VGKQLTRKEDEIARKRLKMRQKEQEADKLLEDLKTAPKAPTSKENWMVDWFRKHAPKAFAACEAAYQKVAGTSEQLDVRKRLFFSDAEDIERSAQYGRDDNDYNRY